MIRATIENLNQLKNFLQVLPEEAYIQKSEWLSGATIGQHMRHILEFYTCLLHGVATAETSLSEKKSIDKEHRPIIDILVVNYDKRARDLEIETKPAKAIETIEAVTAQLSEEKNWPDELFVEGIYEDGSDDVCTIQSSFDRELLYNLEHTIHHQALIRVGLLEQNLQYLLDENFGVAPSTIKARK